MVYSFRTGIALSVAFCLVLVSGADATQEARPRWSCGLPERADVPAQSQLVAGTDCEYTTNTAGAAYDPSYQMEIPVVWHVLTHSDGTGNISDQTIANQMNLLNAHFGGYHGPQGNNAKIRFVMASSDPQGQATNGIERVLNDAWFHDANNAYTSLTWNSHVYLNVFSMNPGGGVGFIGYVPEIPQAGGLVGTGNDAIRLLHSAVDSLDWPHALAHEVGHHFGLFHTFSTSCAGTCDLAGDLICDTPAHNSVTWTCGTSGGGCTGQGGPDNNFMNYVTADCGWEFTEGQIRRMRCTLEYWRPGIFTVPPIIGTNYCSAGPNSTGSPALISATGSTSLAANDVVLSAGPAPENFGLFFFGAQQANVVFGNGVRCVGGQLSRMTTHFATGNFLRHQLDVTAPNGQTSAILPGETWYYQAWFRDAAAGGAQFDLSDGLQITYMP